MTIWNVMKTYVSSGEYYQVIPYNLDVFRALLHMGHGLQAVFKFIKDIRMTEKGLKSWQVKRITAKDSNNFHHRRIHCKKAMYAGVLF